MPKTKISEFSATPASNTDIDSINIAEGCAPSGINDAIRELMAQLKDFQTGAVGDSFNGPVGTTTAAAGAFTTLAASGAVTLSGGTANGVTYLNGSKVVTSGSALVFDGTNLGIGVSPSYKLDVAGGARITPSAGYNAIFQTSLSRLRINYVNDAGSANVDATYKASSFLFQTSSSDAMTLDSSGNLGIGTSSPTAFGSGYTTLTISGSNTGIFQSKNTLGDTRIYAAVDGDAYLGSWANTSLKLYTNSTIKATLDASGNLGLGVTPSVAGAGKTFEIGTAVGNLIRAAGQNDMNVESNTIYNSGFKYANTGFANRFGIGAATGQFQWYTAPSGTAGNAITFTQAMTLTAAGNLGVGVTSPATLISGDNVVVDVGDADGGEFVARRTGGGANLGMGVTSANIGYLFSSTAIPLVIGTNNAEAARIDTSGNLLVGTTSTSGSVNNNTQVVGGIFSTSGASNISALNATATTLVTLPNISAGCWLISVTLPGQSDASAYGCVAVVTTQGTTASIATIKTATLVSLSLSGLAVQITQVSGGTQANCAYTAIRLF